MTIRSKDDRIETLKVYISMLNQAVDANMDSDGSLLRLLKNAHDELDRLEGNVKSLTFWQKLSRWITWR